MIEIILFLLLLSISILLIKRRFEQRVDWTKKSQTPAKKAPQQAGRRSRNYFGWIGSHKWGLLIVLIIFALIVSVVWTINVPGATYTFNSANDLSSHWKVVSGNWQVKNGCLIGSGEIQLKNSNLMKGWSGVKVIPTDIGSACGGQNLDGLSFKTGEVIYRYNIKTARSLGEKDEGSYHIADIYYQRIDDDKLLSFPINEYIKPEESLGPFPVGINRNKWWDFLSPRFEVNVYILNNLLAKKTLALYNGGEKKDEEGGLSIKSDKVIGIKEIKIYY